MLIRGAEIWATSVADLRIADLRTSDGQIVAMGNLSAEPGERTIDARGGALLPGLHDHHTHLMAYAASLHSVSCGPPEISTETELIQTLTNQASRHSGSTWIRGFRYHESVAGSIDRHWLDRYIADHPVRIQHRSGRLWIVNSMGLDLLNETATSNERLTLASDGRLYDQDDLLGRLIGRTMPPLAEASRNLAALGITGITDMTPSNDLSSLQLFREATAAGTVLQRVHVAGTLALNHTDQEDPLTVGPTKIHLHESALPEFEVVCETIASSHKADRPTAIHCVTELELVFALAALREVGTHPADRIEHASVTPPVLVEQIRELSLTVVTQPNFIAERGDAYREAFSEDEQDWLYRCQGFLDAGIRLAGGTDAPFGSPDPWLAMRSAVVRSTHSGQMLGASERLTPEAAVSLFLGSAERPDLVRRIEPGAVADLCLLSLPWHRARELLSGERVRLTIRAGELIQDQIDQTPIQGTLR